MKNWHHERRWKTRVGVDHRDLQTVLNKLSAKGWHIEHILQRYTRATVVATRTVKVYE